MRNLSGQPRFRLIFGYRLYPQDLARAARVVLFYFVIPDGTRLVAEPPANPVGTLLRS